MSLEQLTTITAISQFLEGTQAVAFNVAISKKERYRWVQKTLVERQYLLLGKADKGTVTRYLMKVSIPDEFCHPFQSKAATHSTGNLPPIPE